MPKKAASRNISAEGKAVNKAVAISPRGNQESRQPGAAKGGASLDDLTRTAMNAFLIARDAAFNVPDLFTASSRMAFLAIKECEQELDVIERQIDERLPAAITRVSEARARQLLTNLKSSTDLERIGDLVMSMALRVQARSGRIPASDVKHLVEMAAQLREMLDVVYRGFVNLDLECARKVLQMDKEIDRVCHAMFQKHLTGHAAKADPSSFEVLLMAQALERAGDHTTNLAEDLYNLIEGRSLRHAPKKRAAT